MDSLAQATKKLELKMELLKRKAKIEKERSVLMDKTEEVKKLMLDNRTKRANMRKKRIRI